MHSSMQNIGVPQAASRRESCAQYHHDTSQWLCTPVACSLAHHNTTN